jgi:hypothetical protein
MNLIDTRNHLLNEHLSEVQLRFEKTRQANWQLLDCGLREVEDMRQEVLRKHQEGRFRKSSYAFKGSSLEEES